MIRRAPSGSRFVAFCALAWCSAGCSGHVQTRDQAVPSGGGGGDSGAAVGITYHKDIRPLVTEHCLGCHTEAGVAPFSLEAWAGVEAHAASMVLEVENRTMPPWPADDTCHPLRDSRAMPADALALFTAWKEAGFPEGDPADYKAPKAVVGPQLGDPTLLFDAGEAYTTPRDVTDNYHCFILNAAIDRDTYVTAVDILPGRRDLVHHVQIHTFHESSLASAQAQDAATPEPGYTCFGGSGVSGSFNMFSYRPGTTAAVFEPGDAVLLEAGTRIAIQVHYNTQHLAAGAQPQPDLTQVALWTLPDGQLPDRILRRRGITAYNISVPPGDPKWVTQQDWSLGRVSLVGGQFLAGELVGQTPHAHQIASHLGVTRTAPDGSQSCMVDVPRWNFEWQMDYFYAPDAAVPFTAGDSLRIRCEYDNSPAHQPSLDGVQLQPQQVRWGEGSLDEMCLNYVWLRYDRAAYLGALGR